MSEHNIALREAQNTSRRRINSQYCFNCSS